MNLTREHFRAMIFYDFKSHLTPKQCEERLRNAFGEEAPSKATIYNWYNEYKRDRYFLSDEFREGRPRTAVTDENIAAVRAMLEEDRRTSYECIRATLGIGMSQIQTILHQYLDVRKLCCRWIPHKLTSDQKVQRVEWCRETLEKFNGGTSNLVWNIVTGDESWIYCYEPEKKSQSAQWVFRTEPNPTKIRRIRSAGKKMIASFFSKTGHIATIALEDKRTVTANWYTNVCLPQIFEKVREKRPNGKIILHHDNASSHTARTTIEYLETLKVSTMKPPPYSPDLAPCDFFLFPKIKDKMRGITFSSSDEAVEQYKNLVSEVSLEEWHHCFKEWFHRMQKCINIKGEYFEKQ